MNKKLDGTELSVEDMIELAIEHGLFPREDVQKLMAANHGMFYSFIIQKTQNLRYKLFCEGKLRLDTATPANHPRYGLND